MCAHSFIQSLESVSLHGLSTNESFSVGINAYNAFAIKTLIDYACKYDTKVATLTSRSLYGTWPSSGVTCVAMRVQSPVAECVLTSDHPRTCT